MKTLIPTLLLASVSVAGCGGSGSSATSTTASTGTTTAATQGAAKVSFAWLTTTSTSRLIPSVANSIVVQFLSGSTVISTQTATHSVGATTASLGFTGLPVGDLTLKATAYPAIEGTGTAMATGTRTVTIAANATTDVTLTLASTITSINVTPKSNTVAPGATLALSAATLDSSGATVLNSGLTWTSSNAAVATVGTSGVVTGVAQGSVTLTATDAESGVSGSVNATVTSASNTGGGTVTVD